MTYGVKIMYTYSVEDNKNYFEESIIMLNAVSFDDALDKAEAYANDREHEYINPNNEIVRITKIDVLDCFLVYDNDDEVTEVYSSFCTNNTTLNDDDYYDAVVDISSADELYPLRHK